MPLVLFMACLLRVDARSVSSNLAYPLLADQCPASFKGQGLNPLLAGAPWDRILDISRFPSLRLRNPLETA
jgi:hypothetical protein